VQPSIGRCGGIEKPGDRLESAPGTGSICRATLIRPESPPPPGVVGRSQPDRVATLRGAWIRFCVGEGPLTGLDGMRPPVKSWPRCNVPGLDNAAFVDRAFAAGCDLGLWGRHPPNRDCAESALAIDERRALKAVFAIGSTSPASRMRRPLYENLGLGGLALAARA